MFESDFLAQIPALQTKRLRLRAPQDSDTAAYQEFYADAEASKFYGGPKSPVDAWNKLARDLGHWGLRGYGMWVIEERESGAVIGGCGLMWPNDWPRPELTWWIAAEARQKGFAKEASRAAIDFGYDVLKWDLVQTHMNDTNLAAKALVLSLGGEVFTRETFPDGLTRDVYKLPRALPRACGR